MMTNPPLPDPTPLAAALTTARTACDNSTFFRDYLERALTEAPGDFTALPFTNGELLGRYGEQMLVTSLSAIERIRTFQTSGSTGPAKRCFFTRAELNRTVDFFAAGMARIAPADRPVLILMSDTRPDSIGNLLKTALARTGRTGLIWGRPVNWTETVQVARDAGCLIGLPADLLYLCRKVPSLRPDSVLLSADHIAPAVISALHQTWNCAVYCHYGLTETGYGLAVECSPGQGMHLRAKDFYLEIIDPAGTAVRPPGTPGEITLTSLRPQAVPLVRYRTGDIGVLSNTPCSCGSPAPRLQRVYGRYENLKMTVNIHLLEDILYALPQLAGFESYSVGQRLQLDIEGPKVSRAWLEQKLDCPLKISYRETPPWAFPGKREIHLLRS